MKWIGTSSLKMRNEFPIRVLCAMLALMHTFLQHHHLALTV